VHSVHAGWVAHVQDPSVPEVIHLDADDDADAPAKLKESIVGLQRKCIRLESERDRAVGASEDMRLEHTSVTVRAHRAHRRHGAFVLLCLSWW